MAERQAEERQQKLEAREAARVAREAERAERIRLWREQDHPQRDAFLGDPRQWEKRNGPTATLTDLGERLLGVKSWDDKGG